MRRTTCLSIALLAALALAPTGCGSGAADDPEIASAGAKPSASAAAASGAAAGDDKELALQFAKCMRANGLPGFPDPKADSNGEFTLSLPPGMEKAKVDKAMTVCKKYAPNGGEPPKLDAAFLEKLRAYAKCMRANGVPNFPDPSDSGFQVNGNESGLDPNSPTMKAADAKCHQYAPEPVNGEKPGTSTGND